MVFDKFETKLDFTTLITELMTSEEHIQHLKALHLLSGLLELIAQRGVELNDPILLKLLERLSLITITEKEKLTDEGINPA